jgi:hypothetical protein
MTVNRFCAERQLLIRRLIARALTTGILLCSPGNSSREGWAEQQVPVSYVCTMDADVLNDKPGLCPVCKMDLQPARIETAWSCLDHPAIIKDNAGKCPLDHRVLVPVAVNHFWVCSGNEKILYPDSGRCIDGELRQERKLVRAHGDHNPRHGGQFFMAGDKWHHLEGTYPAPRVFRLYLYDNFTKALDPKGIVGRVFTSEESGRELDPVNLKLTKDGTALEAHIRGHALPQRITVKVRFKSATPEERFDFTFQDLTRENNAGSGRATTRRATIQSAGGDLTGTSRTLEPTESAGPSVRAMPPKFSTPARRIGTWSGDVLGMFTVLDIRTREIRTLIDEGNFALVYAPTLLAKDIALAAGDHLTEVSATQRTAMMHAIKRIVLAAWKLDQFGDLGDRSKLVQAHDEFATAVHDLKSAYALR